MGTKVILFIILISRIEATETRFYSEVNVINALLDHCLRALCLIVQCTMES